MMDLREILLNLAKVVADEAERNPEFSRQVAAVLMPGCVDAGASPPAKSRPKNRRSPAAFDPVVLVRQEGEDALRTRLAALSLDQLKDIVAEYAMDSRRAARWKRDRLVNHIVDISTSRVSKNEVFRR